MDNEMNISVESVAEEDVATMLPTVGLNGEPITKEEKEDIDETDIKEEVEDVNPIGDIDFSESVKEYMNDPNLLYDLEVEEGVKDIVGKIKERVVVSNKTAKLVVDIYILKKKIKRSEKSQNTKTTIDLKRELIRKQKELNNIKKSSSPELQKEITKIEKNLDKSAGGKIDVEDIKTESVDELTLEEEDMNIEIEDGLTILEKEEEKETLPPELKRLDEIRGKIKEMEDDLDEAKKKFDETGEKRFENKVKGLTSKIDKLNKELSEKEKEAKKIEEKNKMDKKSEKSEESKDEVKTEAANMEDEIKPIVDKLNAKGYKVKYSSPGHSKLRKKEDKEPDGVYYSKLYSDARIMFDDKYDFHDAPKYWHWREVDGCSYLDITPINYDKNDGSPDEAFSKWKSNYMNSLKTFVDNLKDKSEKVVKESVNEFAENFMEEMFEKMGFDELEMIDIVNESVEIDEVSSETLLKELEDLLS